MEQDDGVYAEEAEFHVRNELGENPEQQPDQQEQEASPADFEMIDSSQERKKLGPGLKECEKDKYEEDKYEEDNEESKEAHAARKSGAKRLSVQSTKPTQNPARGNCPLKKADSS